MKKRIFIAFVGVLLVVGALGAIKGLQIKRMIAFGQQSEPPVTVTTAQVKSQTWETMLTSVGSLEAVQGVTLTAELSGKVVKIAFEPGSRVRAGDLLVQQDTSSERAQLKSAEANLALAKVNYDRAVKLLPDKVISRSTYDDAEARYKQARAEVDTIRATIAKKTIRAPFDGRLGLRLINVGQIISAGQPIVSLQSLDPIFVNFLLPQQQLEQIRRELTVRVTTDALPGKRIQGHITAINPEVDAATRNIRVQATVTNGDEQLRPGMYVNVAVILPNPKETLAVPATSILYAPYSDSVFLVEEQKNEQTTTPSKSLRQQFVRLGETRGDFVEIIKGLEAGQTVVSTGVFKLRPGQAVVVDNKLEPEFKLSPEPENS